MHANEWAQSLATKQAVVLHTQLGIVGIVSRYWEPGTYPSNHLDEKGDAIPLACAVLSFADGNSFIVTDDARTYLLPLEQEEIAVYSALVNEMSALVLGSTVTLRKTCRPERFPIALALIGTALTAQHRALRAG